MVWGEETKPIFSYKGSSIANCIQLTRKMLLALQHAMACSRICCASPQPRWQTRDIRLLKDPCVYIFSLRLCSVKCKNVRSNRGRERFA